MSVNVYKTETELLPAMADYFIKTYTHAIEENGKFTVALAGGNSPKKLYALLTSDKYKTQVDWSNVFFFFGDERYVPGGDVQRNSQMAQETLFEPLNISADQIFKVDTSLPPDKSAKKYAETINTYFNEIPVRFDLILLGLGDNSHTASLFPYTPVLTETAATVKAVYLKEQDVYRITMTAAMINQSKHIAFLVYGKDKAEAVSHIFNDAIDIEKYPAQLIHATNGDIQWFLDEAAASLLK